MRASGVELDFDQCRVLDDCQRTPIRARLARIRSGCPAPRLPRRGHACAVQGIASNGQFDASGFFFQNALHQRQISFFYGALLERFSKLGLRGIVLSHQNHSGSFLIEAMHDSRAKRITTSGKFEPTPQKRVHQGARHVSRTGMHGHSRGFIDGNDVLVFVEHFERDGFRFRSHCGPLGNFYRDFFAATKMQRSFSRGLAVQVHVPRVD